MAEPGTIGSDSPGPSVQMDGAGVATLRVLRVSVAAGEDEEVKWAGQKGSWRVLLSTVEPTKLTLKTCELSKPGLLQQTAGNILRWVFQDGQAVDDKNVKVGKESFPIKLHSGCRDRVVLAAWKSDLDKTLGVWLFQNLPSCAEDTLIEIADSFLHAIFPTCGSLPRSKWLKELIAKVPILAVFCITRFDELGKEVAGLLEDIDLVSSLSEVAEKKGRSALALQRGLEGWRAAIENMPEHSVSLYAAACGCFMVSSAAQPEGLEQLAAALSKSYPAGQLVKPYAVCKLRRVLAAVGLSPWPDAAGGSASSSSCRLQDMLGPLVKCCHTMEEQVNLGFALRFPKRHCWAGASALQDSGIFSVLHSLWATLRNVMRSEHVTAGSSMGAPDDSILAKEAVQTLEDFAETLPIRCTWKVSAKDLAAGLVQPPFADSVKLTFVVLSCQQGSPADREVKQLEAFVEQLKRNLGQSMLEHVVAEDFTSITPSNRAVTHDFLRLIASSSKRPALGGPNGGQLLKSVLRAIWNLEFPRESFHFLVEAAGCLAPRTSSSASSGSNDGWLDIDEAAAALWNQDRCSNSSFIRELSERKQVPELILPSLCTAFASATKTKKWPAEGRQLCDVQVDVDLRLLAHCISEGLRAGAAWIELLDGKAGQIKELAKAAWSLTIDAEVPCELAQKLVQTKEGSIGAELAYLFEVVREKHRERLQIMEAVSSIPLKLRLHLLNLPIPTPPTTYPACACWSCWSADPQVVAFLKGLACLGDCSSLLRSCIQMAGNHNGSGSGDVQTFQQVLRSATEGLTKLLIRICSGEVTWQDMENGSGELDESEPKRLGILADHLGLREIESHKLRDVLECLHVSPRDRAIQIGKLLQVLESTKKGSDEDVEILKDLLQLVSRQDASIMPARAEQGRHSLGSIRDRLAHLLGVQPPSRLRVLLWEQVDQIRELQPLSAYLEKKSRAEVDQKLEALQTRCVAQPQLVLVVKELRQFVDLFRKLDARSPPLHSMAKLLSEKLPARVDRDRTKELIKLMTSAGSEDIGERGRLHLEELVSPETTLSFQMQDLGIYIVARVELKMCPGALAFSTIQQPVFGDRLENIVSELLNLGVTWATLRPEEKEQQAAREFVLTVKQLQNRVEELRQLEGLVNKLLERGWQLPAGCLSFPAMIPDKGLTDIVASGLDKAALTEQLNRLDEERRAQWARFPMSSWLNGQLFERQIDVRQLGELLPLGDELFGDDGGDDSKLNSLEKLERKRRKIHKQPPAQWCGPREALHTELEPVSMVRAPKPQEAAHFVRQLLCFLNCFRVDALFPCCPDSSSVAIEGLLWRLKYRHTESPVTIVALPESLPLQLQDQLCQQLGACTEDLHACQKYIVIVMGSEVNSLFHRLAHLRRTDLELAVTELSSQVLQEHCPFHRTARLMTGAPLSGKSCSVRSKTRVTIRSDMTELEFCRYCRHILRDHNASELVVDLGWTDLDSKLSQLGMPLLSLLLFGIAGVSLPLPCCLDAPRQHSPPKSLVIEAGPALPLLEGLQPLPILPRQPAPDGSGVLPSLCALAASGPFSDERILQVLVRDFDGLGFGKENTKATPIFHPYTYTKQSVADMAVIFERLVAWRARRTEVAPIIMLLGETGCGKTYMLTKVIELYGRTLAEDVEPRILSLSQAIDSDRLVRWFKDLLKSRRPSSFTVVILDEVNATAAVEVCKRLMVDRCCGDGNETEIVPRDVLFVATGNPGQGRYDVFELPPSLANQAITLNALNSESTKSFLLAHVGQETGSEGFCSALLVCQDLVCRETAVVTSLRDATRCSRLRMQLHELVAKSSSSASATSSPLEVLSRSAEALALYICYGLQVARDKFWKLDIFQDAAWVDVKTRLDEVRLEIWDHIRPPTWVVKTEQLLDNLALLTVAFATSYGELCPHLLLLGNEGAAKTLAVTLFLAAAKGPFSASKLFRELPAAQTVRVQCSSATTAAHLRDVAYAAQALARAQRGDGSNAQRVVVVMEELGMAAVSDQKPLKALHHLMDLHMLEKGVGSFLFVSTSNLTLQGECPLDAALLNRLLVLRSEPLDKDGLLNLCQNLRRGMQYGEDSAHIPFAEVVQRLYDSGRTPRDVIAFALTAMPTDPAAPHPFWLHLQAHKVRETQQLWPKIEPDRAQLQPPSLTSCLRQCLLAGGPRTRHVLITVRSPAHVGLSLASLAAALEGTNREVVTCRSERSQDDEDSRVTLQLTEVALALERGAVLVLLFPRGLLDALHAVLNADYARAELAASTISYNAIHRDVVINPNSRIVIVAEIDAVANFHPALLSRVSILHSELQTERFQQPVSPHDQLQKPASVEEVQHAFQQLKHSLSDAEAHLRDANCPHIIVAVARSFPARQCVTAAALSGPTELARKLRRADRKDLFVLDMHGLTSFVQFLNMALTLGLCGSVPKDWRKELVSKLPDKVLLLISPLLARRFQHLLPETHSLSVWWLDDPARPDGSLTLEQMWDPEQLWANLVQSIQETTAAAAATAAAHRCSSASDELQHKDQSRSFALEISKAMLWRCVPLLCRDPAARLDTISKLAQSRLEVGSLRSLFIAVTRAAARHAVSRFRPWLELCLASECSHSEEGRQMLIQLVKSAALPLLNKLQPAGRIDEVLLCHPSRPQEPSSCASSLFPFAADFMSVIERAAARGEVPTSLASILGKLCPGTVLEAAGASLRPGLGSLLLRACLAHKLLTLGVETTLVQSALVGPAWSYLQARAIATSLSTGLLLVVQDFPVLQALSFAATSLTTTSQEPSQLLLEACVQDHFQMSSSSLSALELASRHLQDSKLRRLSLLWAGLAFHAVAADGHVLSIKEALHCALALLGCSRVASGDAAAVHQQMARDLAAITLQHGLRRPGLYAVLILAGRLPDSAYRVLLPKLVASDSQGAAFMAGSLSSTELRGSRSDQQLLSWLRLATVGSTWSHDEFEGHTAQFAVALAFLLPLKPADAGSLLRCFDGSVAWKLAKLALATSLLPNLARNCRHWDDDIIHAVASLTIDNALDETSKPIQNYFLRLLVFHHGEHLDGFAASLSRLGDWIVPYLQPQLPDADRRVGKALAFLPRFRQQLDETLSLIPALEAVLQLPDIPADYRPWVEYTSRNEAMGCLLGPAVLWAAILGVADRNSAFFWNWYSPDLLQGLVLPAQPDSEAAMLLRLQHQMGIRLIYTCQCGMPYGIGECGQAMEQGRCPNCGAVIGGQNHRLADPGQDRRLGQTQPLTGFGPDRPESGHTERGLAPHVYRFVQLLLLLPLVVWFPEHHHAADLRRRLDLNLQGLARNLGITNDEAAQLTARVLADGKDRLLLPGLRFSGEEQPARQAEAQLVESLRGACPDFVDRPMEVLRRVRRDLEAAGDQLRPIEFLREVELGKLHPAQRLANFASGLLRLPSDTQAALEWEMLSDGDRAALPITSMFQGGTNWEQRARDIQRLRPLVVGWAALHLSTHLQGLTSKTRHLDECIKDGAVASEFVKAWNDLASAGGVEYECQRNLQLPQISMETSAETCHLGPDGTLAQAMFMTLLKVHNEAMKQAFPGHHDQLPVLKLFEARDRLAGAMLDMFALHEAFSRYAEAMKPQASVECWVLCEQALAAQLKALNPHLLDGSWPEHNFGPGAAEVVPVRYNQLEKDAVAKLRGVCAYNLRDEIDGLGPELVGELLSWCQELALLEDADLFPPDKPLKELATPLTAASQLLGRVPLLWRHLVGLQQLLAARACRPGARLGSIFRQLLPPADIEALKASIQMMSVEQQGALRDALARAADAVGVAQLSHPLRDWLCDLDEEVLAAVPPTAKLAHLGTILDVLEVVYSG